MEILTGSLVNEGLQDPREFDFLLQMLGSSHFCKLRTVERKRGRVLNTWRRNGTDVERSRVVVVKIFYKRHEFYVTAVNVVLQFYFGNR